MKGNKKNGLYIEFNKKYPDGTEGIKDPKIEK